jgi:protocatechuate 3,4-dioxygenase beta subunit
MTSDTDDRTRLTRRQTLAAAGVISAGLMGPSGLLFAGPGVSTALGAAVTLTPEQEEGPYYVDLEKVRKDIVLGQAGVPLRLAVTVLNSTTGKPIEGAAVDLWQCSPKGVYSDEASNDTSGQTFLRGVQLTDAEGVASFVTVYPGHYTGRAVHIHVKVHTAGKVSGSTYSGGHVSHTGQMFFDDTISNEVFRLAAYANDSAARVLNTADSVYTQQGGSKSRVRLRRRSGSLARAGFSGTIALAVDPSATPAAVGVSGGGGGPG